MCTDPLCAADFATKNVNKMSLKCSNQTSILPDWHWMSPHFSSTLWLIYFAHLLPPTLGQVLLGRQRADGPDPRLSHALDPQHHPAELLALWHHAVKLLEAGADLRLHTPRWHVRGLKNFISVVLNVKTIPSSVHCVLSKQKTLLQLVIMLLYYL